MRQMKNEPPESAALERALVLRRLGIIMRPQPDNPREAGGVLNPGGVRARNGEYLLFPRLVARGNFSRIGVARVKYDSGGIPIGVERNGIALEPSEAYETNPRSGGGCEDARVTFVPALNCYVMAYVAYGPRGPRSALAVSHDLNAWKRVGLIDFAPHHGADMNIYSNKDAMLFPDPVIGPDGRLSLVLMHRPMYEQWVGDVLSERSRAPLPPGVANDIWTVWLSFCPLEDADWASPGSGTTSAPTFGNHHELLLPQHEWDAVRLGGGTPPIRIADGWFTLYHGIGYARRPGPLPGLRYVAGALVLDAADPRRIVYRSAMPVLEPLLPEECAGVVADVVFPTALDRRDTYIDVFYGMADACIGVARIDLSPGSPLRRPA
jgi:predicted GH43/DUF377 family glycosyl hydrolase